MKKPLLLAFLLAFTFPAFAQYEALTVAGVSAGLGAGGGAAGWYRLTKSPAPTGLFYAPYTVASLLL